MCQNEHCLCKSGATYKHSGEILSRGILLGVHKITAVFMDASSLCTNSKLYFLHNTFVPVFCREYRSYLG